MNILKFNDYIIEKEFFKGGLADSMSADDIAKRHKLDIDIILTALKKGQTIELEHTDDANKAYEIAKDHIFEDPKYYDKLSKVETFSLMSEANDYEFDPIATAERLKRREKQNIERYRAAQDRGDNYAIALYELKIKLDKIDLEKLKVMTAINKLKQKYDKL